MPRSDSPELPSRGGFAPPSELLHLPEVWSMTTLYFEPATHVNIICHLTLTPLLLFLSWSVDCRGVFLHIAGKLWVHPPFGNSFEQTFNIFRRNWRVTIKTSPPLLRNQVEGADVELLQDFQVHKDFVADLLFASDQALGLVVPRCFRLRVRFIAKLKIQSTGHGARVEPEVDNQQELAHNPQNWGCKKDKNNFFFQMSTRDQQDNVKKSRNGVKYPFIELAELSRV